ncbi:hypothetical protein V1477_005149 [Vespula maculifrons]|uniref:Uncharacterized protein n=1 Tax=Vespula maculifrons TaxID=7453 RepID=A0ABD2CPR5_VESMC
MQQPPRGETWVGSTCDISKSYEMQVLPGEWLHILVRVLNLFNLILIKHDSYDTTESICLSSVSSDNL